MLNGRLSEHQACVRDGEDCLHGCQRLGPQFRSLSGGGRERCSRGGGRVCTSPGSNAVAQDGCRRAPYCGVSYRLVKDPWLSHICSAATSRPSISLRRQSVLAWPSTRVLTRCSTLRASRCR